MIARVASFAAAFALAALTAAACATSSTVQQKTGTTGTGSAACGARSPRRYPERPGQLGCHLYMRPLPRGLKLQSSGLDRWAHAARPPSL